MKDPFAKEVKDPGEEALLQLAKDEKEFQNHWLWKELGTSPDTFFKSVKDQVKKLSIPKDQWEKAYRKANDELKTRCAEKRSVFKLSNLQMLGALRV